MEMGFDEKEVIDALRVNNNQQNAAVSASKLQPAHLMLPLPYEAYTGNVPCLGVSTHSWWWHFLCEILGQMFQTETEKILDPQCFCVYNL